MLEYICFIFNLIKDILLITYLERKINKNIKTVSFHCYCYCYCYFHYHHDHHHYHYHHHHHISKEHIIIIQRKNYPHHFGCSVLMIMLLLLMMMMTMMMMICWTIQSHQHYHHLPWIFWSPQTFDQRKSKKGIDGSSHLITDIYSSLMI